VSLRVLGVDPGSIKSGYGLIEESQKKLQTIDFGAIYTHPKDPFPARLLEIKRGLEQVITRYQPQVLALEDVFFAKNVKSALKLGHARGVILVTAMEAGLEIVEYAPLEIKQAVVGYGRADKYQIQQMVKILLGLQDIPQPEDAADALAVAICHIHSAEMRRRLMNL
jgi:crossover junction endodeoxyribonuclease RuvC